MRKQQGRIEKKHECMNIKAKDMPKTIFSEQRITYLYEAISTYSLLPNLGVRIKF